MVSFLCHSCGDVIKKPKLDQHHGRCHAGFDCIDCSVTFKTPAEYKSHTSCISEAEKYQKSLYKGPIDTKGDDNDINNANGNGGDYAYGGRGGRGGFRGRGRGNGRGGFQGRGGYQGGGRPRDEGTGANGTPLGTPQRMSPITSPLDDTPSNSKAKNPTIDTSSSARIPSLDAAPATSPTKNEQSGPSPPSEKPEKEKKHKEKKSNSKLESTAPKGEVKANESAVVEQSTAPLLSSPEKTLDVTEKKRKRKNAKGEQTTTAEPSKMVTEGQAKSDDSKEKKKKKTFKGESASPGDIKTDVTTRTKGKEKKKDKDGEPVGDESKMEVEEKSLGTNGKRKKKSKDKIPDTDVLKVDSGLQSDVKDVKEKKKEEKKRKSEKTPDEPAAPPVEPATEPLRNKDSEKKSKKRKREGDKEDGDAAVAKDEPKRTKKSSDGTGTTPAIAEVKDSVTSAPPSSGRKRKREGKVDVNDAPKPEDKKEKKQKRAKE